MIPTDRLTKYDYYYLSIATKILRDGDMRNNRTGIKAISLPHVCITIDLEEDGFPILASKFVGFKTAIKELLWIWQMQSNDVRKLQDMNVHIWDEWMQEDGTIGKAYGYQLAKYKQVDNLIKTIKEDPTSRRMITTLWNIEDLPEMALQPCAFQTLWNINKGKLNCMLTIRSNDWFLGNPFNIAQYAALVYMIAQVTNYKPGRLTVCINDAHIYENHIPQIQEQLGLVDMNEMFDAFITDRFCKPKLVLNEDIKDFYDFTIDDIKLEGYIPGPKIKAEVAV
nr:MAG TPA: Thymidylate synthase [Caudoviricetes sp.]